MRLILKLTFTAMTLATLALMCAAALTLTACQTGESACKRKCAPKAYAYYGPRAVCDCEGDLP